MKIRIVHGRGRAGNGATKYQGRPKGDSAIKRSYAKYDLERGANRPVTPEAVSWAEERLSGYNKLNSARRRAIFRAVQLLCHFRSGHGAGLPQRLFSSKMVGSFIQHAFEECGIATCVDPDSWKPTKYNFKNAKARSFLPSFELLWADIGPDVVSRYEDYVSGHRLPRPPLHTLTHLVWERKESQVLLPRNVRECLGSGTGLKCDFDTLRRLLFGLPEEQRSQKLCAALQSVGRRPLEHLRPVWRQHIWGRFYSEAPAVINMPNVLLPALHDEERQPLWCVDFASFEARIACSIAGQPLPNGDFYEFLGGCCGLDRARVKQIVNPMLHGQRWEHLYYVPERRKQALHELLPLVKCFSTQRPCPAGS